ncbi:MAG: prepilin-type N-terminal cleavage/methylation domain-containing protein [bacterium]
MRTPRHRRGFTLIEVLAATALLAVLIVLLAKTFDAFYRAMSSSQTASSASDDVSAAAILMGKEMSCAVVRTNTRRFLNLRVSEDGGGVKIYFCAPEESGNAPAEMNFVRHVCYFWDRASSGIYRAVCTNSATAANPERLEKMTLAYQSAGDPYAWTTSAEMRQAMSQAAQNAPLVSGVEKFQAMLYARLPVNENAPDAVNQWNDAVQLPRCLRICFEAATAASAPNQSNHSFSIPVYFPHYGANSHEDY